MSESLYLPQPGQTHAFRTDGTSEWYFWAPKGTRTTDSSWKIVCMQYAGSNWTEKYPVDPLTGLGSDAPKFRLVDWTTYTYAILGTNET